MNKELKKLIEEKHLLIKRIDKIEDKISELTNKRKYRVYKKQKEQQFLK